ncbi:MAG: carbohydrate-binding family 9-like protein [Acidobacteria bacterium]|nr:carbohydrate-binding family 9-like protein [Acidobacteriota bacterium]
MNGLLRMLLVVLLSAGAAIAAEKPVAKAVYASEDVPLTTDATSAFWQAASAVSLQRNSQGKDVPNFHTEVRIRWTKSHLYFLFTCPYDELYLKPSPNPSEETNELWNWDVAEVFIGSNFENIKRYQEFEVSPQGEWVDLDIDLNKPHHETGWTWNSGFEKAARIDAKGRRWYAAMKIPFAAIASRPVAVGHTFRMNLFLSEGAPEKHHEVTWQPPLSDTFHAPERFGILKLVGQ